MRYDQTKDNLCFTNPFSELGDYSQVAVYDIDAISLITVRPYPLGKSFPDPLSLKIQFSRLMSIDEAQKIIDANPKHPQYWQNRSSWPFTALPMAMPGWLGLIRFMWPLPAFWP